MFNSKEHKHVPQRLRAQNKTHHLMMEQLITQTKTYYTEHTIKWSQHRTKHTIKYITTIFTVKKLNTSLCV